MEGEDLRRALIFTTAALAMSIATVNPADAAPKWPAHCTTWKCVNAHLNSLRATVLAQKTKITNVNGNLQGFFGCLYETPVTEWGDPSGTFGYLWTDDGNPADAYATTGFDYTATGNIPDFWAFYDNCSRNTPARVGKQTVTRGGYSMHLLGGSHR